MLPLPVETNISSSIINKQPLMKTLLQYLGIIILLLGVGVLALHYFALRENVYLAVGLGLICVGIVAHLLISKYLK